MDSHNLATLFGPNILHKAKATEKEFTVESMERAEERKEVIDVVQSLIDSHQLLFQVSSSLNCKRTFCMARRLHNFPVFVYHPLFESRYVWEPRFPVFKIKLYPDKCKIENVSPKADVGKTLSSTVVYVQREVIQVFCVLDSG